MSNHKSRISCTLQEAHTVVSLGQWNYIWPLVQGVTLPAPYDQADPCDPEVRRTQVWKMDGWL